MFDISVRYNIATYFFTNNILHFYVLKYNYEKKQLEYFLYFMFLLNVGWLFENSSVPCI